MSAVQLQLHTLIDSLDEEKLLKVFEFTKFIEQENTELVLSEEEEQELAFAVANEERFSSAQVKKMLHLS